MGEGKVEVLKNCGYLIRFFYQLAIKLYFHLINCIDFRIALYSFIVSFVEALVAVSIEKTLLVFTYSVFLNT